MPDDPVLHCTTERPDNNRLWYTAVGCGIDTERGNNGGAYCKGGYMKHIEMIEEYLYDGNGGDYQWFDNHGTLVRCENCKAWLKDEQICAFHNHKMLSDDFCSWGEKKDV